MKALLFIAFLACTCLGFAQTQFWVDDFEGAAPSSGTRVPENDGGLGGPPFTSYFCRTPATATVAQSIAFSGMQGTNYWAGEDHDAAGTGFAGAGTPAKSVREQQIDWSVNIAGKSTLSFTGSFAANSNSTPFDNRNVCNGGATTNTDYIILRYRIDGGAYVDAIRFFTKGATIEKYMFLETTGDSCGETPQLTNIFQDFSANIAGTGTTLDLQLVVYTEGNNEEWGVDNFRLYHVASCTPPTVTGNPPNRSVCTGNNTTFGATFTGATSYQWQVNNGAGFTSLSNDATYSNVTTNTLTITGVTGALNGNLYRCIGYNGVVSCFTNSNSGTLNVSDISTASGSQTNVSCNLGNNGAASVSPSGGIGAYTYSWSPSGGTGSIATTLSAGTYTVTVTDGIGCQATRSYTITQPTALVLNMLSQTNVACFGGSTGAAQVQSASGGTPGYTYDWTPGTPTGDGTTSITGLAAGTYVCTVTDANSCTRTRSFTVTQPASVVSGSTVVTNVACNGGTTGAIDLTPAGGTPGYTYNWGGGVTTQDRTSLAAGSYSVTITDANGCTAVVPVTVTQPTAISGTTVVTNVACNGGTTGAINLTPTGGTGPYTFNWGGGVTSEDRTGLTAGTYSVTITDANGCTGVVSPTVTQPAAAVSGTTVVTNVACFGGNTGAINLTPTGGTGPYTFSWGGGVTTEDRTTLTAGSYSVTITDANGCTGTVSATVTQPAAVVSGSSVVTNVACFGGSNGAINLTPAGGVGPYTFNWGGGVTTEDRTGLVAGSYSVTITDANGCTGSASATVTQPAAAVSGTTVVTNIACFGGNTGAINLTPTGGTGPYTFSWGGGITTEDRTSLTAGTYSVMITDANGCTGAVSATVTQPAAAVSGSVVITNVACNGGTNGAINLTPTGGTGPYTFNWGGGVTTEDRTGLAAGTYSVTITDANGCTGVISPTVTQPTAVSGSTVVTNVACFGGNTGAINLTPTGGTGPYTFSWGGGVTTEDRTSLTAGTYSVTITDANGCTGVVSPTVTQPAAAVSGTTVVTNVACFGGNTGAINLTPTGGVGPYTFNWVGGATTEDRVLLTAGTYSVTITDANGCTGTVSATVTQPAAAVSGTTVVTNIACFGGNTGAINLTPTGGTGPYTFSWGGGVTTEDRTSLTAGTYSVTITDANGCTGVVSPTVTQPAAAVSGTTVVTNVACFGGNTGAINLTPTGGTGPYTFSWGGGVTTEDRTSLTAGTYSVTITDANGCTGVVSPTVTQPAAAVSGTTVVTNVSCFGGSNGAINLTPTGGVGPYTFNWVGGATTEDRTALVAGSYSVTITDANGCTGTVSATVTQPAAVVSGTTVVTNVSCFGGSNGAINLTPAGGTSPYTFNWVGGVTTEDRTGLIAGSYSVTITDANGCTGTTSATVTEPTALVLTAATQTNVSCNGGSTGAASVNAATGGTAGYTYNWTPGNPTGDGTTAVTGLTAGTWTCTTTDANGCTASASFTVTQPTAISVTVAAQTNVSCFNGSNGAASVNTATGGTAGYTYNWTPGNPAGDGTTAVTGLTAGTWVCTATDANGCTGTRSFTITQPALITSSVTTTACDSYTLNSQTYTASGTYTQTLTAANGCDSVLTLNLTIKYSTTHTITTTACSSYTLNAQTYTASGTYTQLLTNVAGCDSTITLNLTINQPSTSTLTVAECSSYTLNGFNYNASGTYTQTLTNAIGCDSVITLNLTINMPDYSIVNVTACDSYTMNGQTYTASGTYTQSLTNAAGCDSIVTLNLTINTPTSSTMSATECVSYTLNGQTYTTSGTYTQMLTNAAGCDSTLTLNLTILQPTSSTMSATECNSYTLNGQTYTASGTYTQVVTNAAGCDSTITLNLTILPAPFAQITQTGPMQLQATATGTTSYQWIDCSTQLDVPGATSANFTATVNGFYGVVVSNGVCEYTSPCLALDEAGMEEMAAMNIVVSPNPATDVFTVTMTGINNADVIVYDAQGKVVLNISQVASGESISLGNIERGIYLVQVNTPAGIHTERLVKE